MWFNRYFKGRAIDWTTAALLGWNSSRSDLILFLIKGKSVLGVRCTSGELG